ncbi:MAG: Phage gp6-like head-tail connector protein [Syntrophorhabdus sp. PtaU1.Bin153]|nr:MAG: Phage gp6-like head-tail connector protein [Syntrophorhabdus sp. PtaU1.Bin153]
MKTLYTAPTIEPISLSELKLHLRIDSGSFADNVDETQSIAPGAHAIANNYTTHVGTAVDVLDYTALVSLQAGANGATGTVDVKIQESDDNATWTDWTGGAFTQVTTANDNATYEKAYTGTKQYIRTVARVLLAACEFGTTIIRLTGQTTEDDLLNGIIYAAREHVENVTRRALLTQTWDYYLDEWPDEDYIRIPFGNLQSVTSVSYKDEDGTETTLTATTDYLVETNGDQCGRIVLPYGVSWPSGTLYPSNPIKIRFIAGWTTAALVPYPIKAATKMICADLYENRERQIVNLSTQTYQENKTVSALLANYRLWEEF